MGFEHLMIANFEIVQTGLYSQTELNEMIPFDWEVCIEMVKRKQERKNKMTGN